MDDVKSEQSKFNLSVCSLSKPYDIYDNWRCQNCLNISHNLFFSSSYPVPRRSRWRWLENPLLHLTLSLSSLKRGIYHIQRTTAGPDAIFFTQQKEMYPLIPLSLKTPPHLFCLHAVRCERGPKGLVQKIKCFTTWMSCKKHCLWLQKNGALQLIWF